MARDQVNWLHMLMLHLRSAGPDDGGVDELGEFLKEE